jgi:hypothetical protein
MDGTNLAERGDEKDVRKDVTGRRRRAQNDSWAGIRIQA